MALQIGQILDGKYRIMREIGHGSMGAVYEGENVMLRRRVAIKVLHPAVAENAATVQRFEREAQAAGRIGSDHIVEVLDLGSMHDGSYYMVMEFLEGKTLSQRIRSRGRLGPREVAPIAQQLLTGLEAAHKAGIVHRDLKPDNVFLQENRAGLAEFVKILDFGVSKFNPLNAEEHLALTRAGAVVGTPFYMSPEQAKGARDVDARADLYSVGVIIYEAVTGQKPFHAGTFSELIFKIVLEAPPPPEHYVPDLDPSFSRIIRRAMAREPAERYQSAPEMRDALSIWLHTGRDVAPGTQLAAPLPPPPGTGLVSRPPPPGSVEEENENAATRIVDDESTATRVVDQSPLAAAPSAAAKLPAGGAPQPPPPPSRRPARTAPMAAQPAPRHEPLGARGGLPRTTLQGLQPGQRPAAPPVAMAPGVAVAALASPAPAQSPPAPLAPAQPTVPFPAAAAPEPAAVGPIAIIGTPVTDATAHAAVVSGKAEASPAGGFAPDGLTPPRGIPGLRPLATKRTAWMLGAGLGGVVAITAIGVGVVVASSPADETAASTGDTSATASATSTAAATSATAAPAAAVADVAIEPSGDATAAEAAPTETVAALTEPGRPPRAPPPRTKTTPTAEAAPPPPTAPEAPPSATGDGTARTSTKGKGRSYATEL